MAGWRKLALAAVCAGVLLAGSATAGGAGLGPVKTTPGFAAELQSLAPDATYGGFVVFNGGTKAEHAALLATHGLTMTADFQSSINAVYAVGTVAQLRALTYESTAVKYLEENKQLTYHGDTAVWASRARVAQEAVSGGPFVDGAGSVLTGQGIGVAIVDSGINALHPDLTNRVAGNVKIVCSTPALVSTATGQCFGPVQNVEVGKTDSDTSSGHGTHVSGIVAGDGTQSTGPYPVAEAAPNVKGTFTGVAPGATLFGWSTGEAIAVLYAMDAWQQMYDNYDSFQPRIRIANQSFGETGGATYDPNSVEAAMVKQLVGKGITMVFSAGNEGGDGTTDSTSSYCDDPTPGVICVANYKDFDAASDPTGTGNRDADLSADSSRGLSSVQASWPDISAPGSYITAACIRGVQPVCATGIVDEIRWGGFYGSISGTSMASPHIVGVAALLLQGRPDLTPAQIEDVLQDTAHKYTFGTAYSADAQNAGGTTSVDKGAGLVDVPAALKTLTVRSLGGGLPTVTSGTPAVTISGPAAGSTQSAKQFTAAGTANNGASTSTWTPPVQWIADGDGGDYSGFGAADLASLSVQEGNGGMTYSLTVRDAADRGPTGASSYRLYQNVNGLPFQTSILLDGTGAHPAAASTSNTAVATSASVSGNTVTFFVPFGNLGDPPAGSPAHNVHVFGYVGAIQDYMPSPNPSSGAEGAAGTRPMEGKPYTIARPAPAPAPGAAAVAVSVDGKAPVAATLTGSGPNYGWSLDVKGLRKGSHTLQATLALGGVQKASNSVSFSTK